MKKLTLLLFFSLMFLAACSAGGNEQAAENAGNTTAASQSDDTMMEEDNMDDETAQDDAMMEEDNMDDEKAHDDAMMEEDNMDGEMVEDDAMMEDEMMSDDTMMTVAAWQTLPLTNAATGESFTLADFAGKTVFVEPMATWCGNCRRQLGNVNAAKAQLNSDEVVFIALSVETNVSDAELTQYAENAGFDLLFAVSSPELLQQLADQFGRTVANPPSTPHFIIRPDGSSTDLVTGIETPDQLIEAINAARG